MNRYIINLKKKNLQELNLVTNYPYYIVTDKVIPIQRGETVKKTLYSEKQTTNTKVGGNIKTKPFRIDIY